jgi:hypothetical protein
MSGPFAGDEKCQEFAADLKRMMDLAGWGRDELAAQCQFSTSVINNIMGFQRAPTTEHGMAIDRAFGLKNMFRAKARAIRGESYPETFVDFPEHEATADDLFIWDHSVFPGVIQTPRYGRAVFATLPNITADEIERRVAGRLARQEAVLGENGKHRPRVWALMDEAALRRPVAAAEVMYEQCLRAVEVSRLPHVSLAVVPYAAGGHIGLSGACTIIERDGQLCMVFLDDLADGHVSEDPAIIRRVARTFRSLQHEALPGGASRDMIKRVAEERWTETAPDGARALTALPTARNV